MNGLLTPRLAPQSVFLAAASINRLVVPSRKELSNGDSTLYQLISKTVASLAVVNNKAITFSIISIGSTASVVQYVGAGGDPVFNATYKAGSSYIGVPGPELAGGLRSSLSLLLTVHTATFATPALKSWLN